MRGPECMNTISLVSHIQGDWPGLEIESKMGK
jgi:hypothetical protein